MAELIGGIGDETQGNLTQEILDDAVKHLGVPGHTELVDVNDYFEFECQQCGACCMNRTDIILNAFDIYSAAKYLGITTTEFIRNYTIQSLGSQSRIPMITLKCDEKTAMCPFLEFDYMGKGSFKCKIHAAKPGSCRSHPLGLVSQCDMSDIGKTNSIKTNFIKVEQCPQSKTGKMQRVGDWMQYYIDHQEDILKAHEVTIVTNSIVDWREFYLMTGVFGIAATRRGKRMSNDMMTQAFNILASLLIEYGYAHFETDKDFSIQCDENRDFLQEQFTSMHDTLIVAMREVFKETCGISVEEALGMTEKEDIEQVIAKIGMHCTYEGVDMDEGMPDDMEEDYNG